MEGQTKCEKGEEEIHIYFHKDQVMEIRFSQKRKIGRLIEIRTTPE